MHLRDPPFVLCTVLRKSILVKLPFWDTCRPRPGGKRVTPTPLQPASSGTAAVPPAEPASPGSHDSLGSEQKSSFAFVSRSSPSQASVRKSSSGGGSGGATLQQQPAIVPVAVTAGSIAAPAVPPRQHKAVFEAEMHDWASQVLPCSCSKSRHLGG